MALAGYCTNSFNFVPIAPEINTDINIAMRRKNVPSSVTAP